MEKYFDRFFTSCLELPDSQSESKKYGSIFLAACKDPSGKFVLTRFKDFAEGFGQLGAPLAKGNECHCYFLGLPVLQHLT